MLYFIIAAGIILQALFIKTEHDQKFVAADHHQYVADRNDNISQYLIQFPILSHNKAFSSGTLFICLTIGDS